MVNCLDLYLYQIKYILNEQGSSERVEEVKRGKGAESKNQNMTLTLNC